MRKLKEKTAEIKFGVFEFDVRVIFSNNPAQSRKKRDRILGEANSAECSFHAAHCWKANEPTSYVFLPIKGLSAGTIAHEAWHVIHRMLKFCGAEIDNETVAYHLGYLVDKIHEAAKR